MAGKFKRDVIHRWEGNPLIHIDEVPFKCIDILNAGVTRYGNQYLLLITVESLQGRCRLHLARSTDGINFHVEAEPLIAEAKSGPFAMYETLGIRDPRITQIDGTYYITYAADCDHGVRLALASTKDFKTVKRVAIISQPDTKNGALFPRKINGRYAMLVRPSPGHNVWIEYSDDLMFWGAPQVVMTPRDRFWDMHRVGIAAPPVEIDEGWLFIYYGQKITSAGPLMRLGAAVLDRDEPSKVLARSNIPILSPRQKYERVGDVGNIVFSCGMVLEDDGEVKVYYGAADSCICLATATLDQIVRTIFESDKEF